ncbi:hypothetical protein [Klebsiella pneumoniae]|uniref:hypothetical protein n=1 Tax=Klebsiella pneumoniae TaxID=573 RepID=UPI00296F1FF6|nr:hypothetical protein [Klebsiella pneumoniae]MDW3858810.1 hypothetical protein [Klebsiella pneumoniae]
MISIALTAADEKLLKATAIYRLTTREPFKKWPGSGGQQATLNNFAAPATAIEMLLNHGSVIYLWGHCRCRS